ncbi:MAG TPA: anaerobic glycerol-3-phosphate dehydrogenase subunit C [Candidatus Dormibacteraeota bacterium]|nr:anaerobic glycerol-3-phosphate dehydrogenase subunit C [Candidatus Dormibacteraeota bacterium]
MSDGPIRLDLDEVALSADRCIKCNVCNTVCPVLPVTDLFPGPKYCGPQAQRFRLGAPVEAWVDYCSGCGACSRACPSGVKVAELNTRARARVYETRGLPATRRLRNALLSRSELLGRVGSPLAPVANLALRFRPGRVLADRALGVARDAPLPAFTRGTFRARFPRLPQPEAPRRRVAYFHGCTTNYYEPWVGEATVRVLAATGTAVELPAQRCCGLPFISNGDFAGARRLAEANLHALLPVVRSGTPVVATSTSCSLTLKHEYRDVLGLHGPQWDELAAGVYDLFELLRDLVWRGELEPAFGPLPSRVLYHGPCQLRSHGVGQPAAELLAGLAGIELADSGVECCGVAGTYGFKAEKYDIARRVGAPLQRRAAEHRAERVACDSETCRWQIEALTGLPARHPVELLAEAMEAR